MIELLKSEWVYLPKIRSNYMGFTGRDIGNSGPLASLFDFTGHRFTEKSGYYYHNDHIGSSSLITHNGDVIQKLDYLPFGELWYDKRYDSNWETSYTFSGKERDPETGLSYFSARYYDSEAGIWISVDPLLDNYPSFSPYVYCANNPIIYYDPDGRKILPADRQSVRFMKSYFREIFGSSKMFRFSGGELKIRKTQFQKYYNLANGNKQELLNGFKEAILTDKKLQVAIISDGDSYTFSETVWTFDASGYPSFYDIDLRTLSLGDAAGKTGNVGLTFNVALISDQKGNKESYFTDDIFTLGNFISYNFKNKGRASDVFIHEVLDEFLNVDVKGGRFVRSPQGRVFYQNKALQEKGQNLRNASDHDQ